MSSNADALDRTDADRLERVGTDKPKYRTISDGFDTDRACLLIRGLPAGMVCGWESGWPQPAPGCGRLTAGHVRDGNSRSPGFVSRTRQIRLVRTSRAASTGSLTIPLRGTGEANPSVTAGHRRRIDLSLGGL